MSNLRTNYKDDVFTGKRKYSEIDNGDGTISFDDVTDYAQVGDTYGAAQINETNDVINNLDSKAYKSTDGSESGLDDNDYFPFYDTSASATKKTLWSTIKTALNNVFAPKSHASSSGTYGTGSGTLYGHVKLSDNYSTSAGAAASAVGASSKAVYDSYSANRNAITSLSGTVTANQQTETQHYNALLNNKAPNNHASPSVTYGVGDGTYYGHLRISDNTTTSAGSASDGVAASSAAVVTNRTVETNHYNTLVGYHNEIVGELTANNNRIYMDYQNGKYGYNTSANRGADTFHPFRAQHSDTYTLKAQLRRHSDSYGWNTSAMAEQMYGPMVGNGTMTFISWTWDDMSDDDSTSNCYGQIQNITSGQSISRDVYNANAGSESVNQSISYSDGDYICARVKQFNHFANNTSATITYRID